MFHTLKMWSLVSLHDYCAISIIGLHIIVTAAICALAEKGTIAVMLCFN